MKYLEKIPFAWLTESQKKKKKIRLCRKKILKLNQKCKDKRKTKKLVLKLNYQSRILFRLSYT